MSQPFAGPDDADAAATPAAGPARRAPKRRKRISYRLATLSSAAVLAVYAAGYARTATAERQLTAPPPVVATQPARGALVAPPTATGAPAGPTSPAVAPPPARAAGLRDGIYTGTGTSRHGDIGVTVVVKGGRIVSAEVTQCSTRYPCSLVTPLEGRVVTQQGAPVDYISGATDSSEAFQGAVADALAQARP
ncbi:MAG TPA: FMN-binding protein [Thermomicrobiales bacterium]|nr:FMN-binding protein [Thermomicrobiales bacterium]